MSTITGTWLKQHLTSRRGEHADLARHMGITPPKLTRLLKEERGFQPGEREAAIDFLRRRGLLSQEDVEALDGADAGDAGDLVSVYDIAASAGPGAVPSDYEGPAFQIRFPSGFLAHLTSTSPLHLKIIGIRGDSMEPTLRHDDAVIVDTTKINLGYDGIFVLRLDDALVAKRIARGGTPGRVLLISDNREYPPADYAIGDIHVVGRVLFAFKKF